eukprot:TRINITY_DN70801_c0_g1_i1.p1 TRINITY_DN70801_c0_g1~~TRINITY_DN70801_c0_g1_i1.p1  ORF type:complete len:153 (+),score=15.43 TRINITY_DN70801_c0_g1_i1:610-1068(+)
MLRQRGLTVEAGRSLATLQSSFGDWVKVQPLETLTHLASPGIPGVPPVLRGRETTPRTIDTQPSHREPLTQQKSPATVAHYTMRTVYVTFDEKPGPFLASLTGFSKFLDELSQISGIKLVPAPLSTIPPNCNVLYVIQLVTGRLGGVWTLGR